MSTHNRCFEQKYEKYQNFSSENFHFLVVNFSVYLNRYVFVMNFHLYYLLIEECIKRRENVFFLSIFID